MDWRRDQDDKLALTGHLLHGYELRGRGLRFVLLAEIRSRRTMTIAEMVAFLAADGYDLAGRPSKIISDALRWEVARGPVVRVGRGVYRYGRTPATTARRVRSFAQSCNQWIVAVMRGEEPPPTPPTPPERRAQDKLWSPHDPSQPPWYNLGWLWTT